MQVPSTPLAVQEGADDDAGVQHSMFAAPAQNPGVEV